MLTALSEGNRSCVEEALLLEEQMRQALQAKKNATRMSSDDMQDKDSKRRSRAMLKCERAMAHVSPIFY